MPSVRESTCSCVKLLRPMLRLLFRKKSVLKRKRTKKNKLLPTKKLVTSVNTRPSLRNRESRRRKSVKSKDLESYKKRLLIDKPRSMPLEPRELLKKVKDKLESVRDLSRLRKLESPLILRLLDSVSSLRSNQA